MAYFLLFQTQDPNQTVMAASSNPSAHPPPKRCSTTTSSSQTSHEPVLMVGVVAGVLLVSLIYMSYKYHSLSNSIYKQGSGMIDSGKGIVAQRANRLHRKVLIGKFSKVKRSFRRRDIADVIKDSKPLAHYSKDSVQFRLENSKLSTNKNLSKACKREKDIADMNKMFGKPKTSDNKMQLQDSEIAQLICNAPPSPSRIGKADNNRMLRLKRINKLKRPRRRESPLPLCLKPSTEIKRDSNRKTQGLSKFDTLPPLSKTFLLKKKSRLFTGDRKNLMKKERSTDLLTSYANKQATQKTKPKDRTEEDSESDSCADYLHGPTNSWNFAEKRLETYLLKDFDIFYENEYNQGLIRTDIEDMLAMLNQKKPPDTLQREDSHINYDDTQTTNHRDIEEKCCCEV